MSSTIDRIRYVKHNKVSLKADKREESTEVLLRFFRDLEEKATGMIGFVVMNNVQDSQDSVVLTFWESKEDMDAFYQRDNKALSNLVETLEPSFEHLPERKDYQVVKFKI
jgi:heme-degrading monooxygenase HmoA